MYKPFIEHNLKKLNDNHAILFFEIDATQLDQDELVNQLDPAGK